MNHKECHGIVNLCNSLFEKYGIRFEPMTPLSDNSYYSVKIYLRGNKYVSSSSILNLEDKFYKKLRRKILQKHGKDVSFNNTKSIFWFKL